MTTTETAWDAADYYKSVGKPALIAKGDGASLYRIDSEHYMVFTCDAHDEHDGHRTLVRKHIAKDWECFAQFFNPDAEFSVFHYGPERTNGQLAELPVPA